ncbi:MAG TPA: hypothetical protein DDW86_08375 [Clostridiales bacterium]|nr:hypothetical protein [Clostridiales bacterium]
MPGHFNKCNNKWVSPVMDRYIGEIREYRMTSEQEGTIVEVMGIIDLMKVAASDCMDLRRN